MDFSENIAMKTTSEVQEAHFSGKQYTLHCTFVQPGEVKLVYHLSDDTTHDPSFMQQVRCWKIFLIAGKLETKL